MGYVIFGIILSLFLFVILGFKLEGMRLTWVTRKRQAFSLFGLLVILLGFVALVPANTVGVLFNPFGGGIQDDLLQEGYQFKSPFENVYTLTTEASELTFEDISVQTSDSQWISTKLQIQLQIDKAKAFDYFKKYRNKSFLDIQNILKSTTQRELEAISTKYNVMEILGEKRGDIVNETLVNLQKELIKDGIVVNRFVLVDTDAGDLIENAIAKEAAAKKEADAAKWLKEKATEEGNAKVIAAQKEKEANEIITASLTKEILYEMYLDKWDGKLPQVVGSEDILLNLQGNN